MTSLRRSAPLASAVATCLLLTVLATAARTAPTLDMEVDITDLPRQLIHAKISVPAKHGPLALWYPKWVPGIHAPRGPVQNLAGFRITSPAGEKLDWRRDDEELYRFQVDVPEGVESVLVHLDYIANQASVNSKGVDVHGNALLGAINWNTCVVYPQGHRAEDIRVNLRVRLPKGWRYGTSLPTKRTEGGQVHFESVSLQTLLDSPLICGENFRTIDLKSEQLPPAYLHLTSESATAIQLDDDLVAKYRRLIAEGGLMFGGAPYDEYHFLVTCSDQVGGLGLEHLRSSLNGVTERSLIDAKLRRGWAANLLPHEYVHAWCGKYRRPRGMTTSDFHTPKHTELLWIYEGLTTYLGEVLAARCGLHTYDEQLEHLAVMISRLNNRKGRRWRSLEDTAISSYHLRARSQHWGSLRRSQDYYQEGMLYWMEADAIIRQRTDGQKSLDDFCQRFFAHTSDQDILPYDLDEVYSILAELSDYGWPGFFDRRVYRVQEQLPLDVVARCGYRLQYATEPSDYVKANEDRFKAINETDSIGVYLAAEGKVNDVVPGSAADQAGLAPGMEIIGVNGRKFSKERFRDAIAESISQRTIELLIAEGERFRTITVDYADGPRFLKLVRDSGKADILKDIMAARAAESAATE